MPELRILWTALPRAAYDNHLVLDVFVSHRLGVDGHPDAAFVLSDFPEAMDWPAQVANHLSFAVELSTGGPVVAATRIPWTDAGEAVDLHPPTWQRLFPPTTPVEPWTRRHPGSRPIFSFPVTAVADYIKDRYKIAGQKSAIDPTADDDLDEIADDLGGLLDTRPDAERPQPTSETTGGETTGGGPAASPQPLGCLTAPFAWLIWLVHRLRQILFGGPPPGPQPSTEGPTPPPVSVTPKVVTYTFPPPGAGPIAPAVAAIEQHVAATGVSPPAGWTPPGSSLSPETVAVAGAWRFYRRPESEPPRTARPNAALVPPPPPMPRWDFHQRMGALGDYPGLLHRLGIVIRLRMPRPATPPSSVRLIPHWDGQPMAQRDLTPRTCCVLDGDSFLAEAQTGSDLRNGFLDLTGASEHSIGPAGFRMLVVDADGAALKLVHTAASLVRRRHARLHGLVRDQQQPEGLAALRTAGIAIVRDGHAAALKARLEHLDAVAPATRDDAPEELFYDHVVRGFRVEVHDLSGPAPADWRSLCERNGTYHLLADDGTVQDKFQIADQGYVKRTAATSADAESSPLYVHEALVRWTGWSLVAPRPGRRIKPVEGTFREDGRTVPTQREVAVPPAQEVRPELHMAATFRAVDGSLPRLRLGGRYRFRLPAVDLAGESQPVSDVTPVSDAITYRRFEPLAPPALLPAAPFMAGESTERLVIRSDVTRTADDYATHILKPINGDYRADAVRHVFPAKITSDQAEQHGCLDGAIGSADPAQVERGWNVSLRADNALSITSLRSLDDPDVSAPFGEPGARPIAGSVQTYAINTYDGPLPTPYLPDPLAAAVVLRGLPAVAAIPAGATLDVQPVLGAAGRVCLVPFEDEHWPEVPSFRIRVIERPGIVDAVTGAQSFTHADDPPHWDPVTRVLTVFLAKGQTAEVPYSSVPRGDRLDWLGAAKWLAATAGSDLERQMALGCHWMVSPARALTLVHAVPQPLAPASLSSGDAAKTPGATLATVSGRMRLDPATTGQVTLLAVWEDKVDDGMATALVTVPGTAVLDTFAVSLPLVEGTAADTAFPPKLPPSEPVAVVHARHEFGDTGHRLVDYRLRASTRFREYFPAELQGLPKPDGSDGFSRIGDSCIVSVPNSEPPIAPSLRYAIPSFGWDAPDPQPLATWTSFARTRSGGGIRVFLDRPWFMSGPGEQVGVVVARPGQKLPDTIGSQLGVDPTWSSAFAPKMPVLAAAMFSGGAIHPDVALRDGTHVDVVGYEPSLDLDRNQWFVDVSIDMAALPAPYWPFVRLAVTRFQPESIEGAMASKVMLADPIQLAPDRRLTVAVAGTDVIVRVSGRGPAQRGQNLMLIALDVADNPDPDELAWRPVGSAAGGPEVSDPVEARLGDAVRPTHAGGELRWDRTLQMPGPRGDRPLRVIVRELELREADPDVVEARFAVVGAATPIAAELIRSRQLPRVVYADSVRLA
jgi:hypothetical protein